MSSLCVHIKSCPVRNVTIDITRQFISLGTVWYHSTEASSQWLFRFRLCARTSSFQGKAERGIF